MAQHRAFFVRKPKDLLRAGFEIRFGASTPSQENYFMPLSSRRITVPTYSQGGYTSNARKGSNNPAARATVIRKARHEVQFCFHFIEESF